MKKLLFILSLITVQSFGQSIKIINTSYDSTDIQPNSVQYFDVLNFTKDVSIQIIIVNYDSQGKIIQSKNIGIIDYGFFKEDIKGVTRVNFAAISSYDGAFKITAFVMPGNSSESKGVFNYNATTGLNDLEYSSSEQIKEVFYYNLNGVKIENPNNYEGVLIKRNVYLNGSSKTMKCIYK